MEPTKVNLELVPTLDILKELATRYDNLIFGGSSDVTPAKPTTLHRRRINWHGDVNICLSLVSQLGYAMNQSIVETMQDSPEDDDG